MTLKQFLQLAAGAGIAFLLFVSPIPGFVKWPLIIFFAFFGIALAFLPIEQRPLSNWIFAFFKAVYSPTQYEFRQGAAEEVFGKQEPAPIILTPKGEEKAKEYLEEVPRPHAVSILEKHEKNFVSSLFDLFGTTATRQAQTTQSQTGRVPIITEEVVEPEASKPTDVGRPQVSVQTPTSIPIKVPHQEEPVAPPTSPSQTSHTPYTLPTVPVAAPVFGPQRRQTPPAAPAVFVPEASPPNPPSLPNTVVGQVVTEAGRVIESAILEIRDAAGMPRRALRTNKIGHFLSVTPLEDGEYEIETEKEGYAFDAIRFRAEGKIIPPILIKAKSAIS